MKVAVIPGDGVGHEVVDSAIKVLNAVGFEADYHFFSIGYARWRKDGVAITEEDLKALEEFPVILKGPVQTTSSYESPTVRMRQHLDLYANVRPVKSLPHSPHPFHMVIVRENTEGSYAGRELLEAVKENYGFELPTFRDDKRGIAVNVRVVTGRGCERVSKFAFEYAQRTGMRKVVLAHKANVIRETDGFFRDIFFRVSKEYPKAEARDANVDALAMSIVQRPQDFDVIVTENLYGDILSDIAASLSSIGLLGSMNLGEGHRLFEPVHGTAPDIAGKGVANPIGQITAARYMAQEVGFLKMAARIERAVDDVLLGREGLTPDLGGTSTTDGVTSAILKRLQDGC